MDAIDLSIFSNRIDAICEEMGVVLRRSAFSPNIMDRLDFSCAIFDANGHLCAQAAHIPVHLGSMAFAMSSIVSQQEWQHGDMLILNDPYLGGTHLPDITLIAPLFIKEKLCAFVVNRAHHADIGAETPGSMPVTKELSEEGMIIHPTYLLRGNLIDEDLLQGMTDKTKHPRQSRGDFIAQISANRIGLERLMRLIENMTIPAFEKALIKLNDYAQRLSLSMLKGLPCGTYNAEDYMDDDGLGHHQILIKVRVDIHEDYIDVDFDGSAEQVAGNVNCPLSVTAAAVYYVFRCLMPDYTPACHGSFRLIEVKAPQGSILNANYPAAVAAGNVETSTRLVDVLLLALSKAIPDQIPAASHGSMNNLAMGSAVVGESWDYYETIGGGMGASAKGNGLHALQTHMTNTLNTPLEVLEARYPLRLRRYAIRAHSGGDGQHRGGNGIIREFEFMQPTEVTLLTERRFNTPWGLSGGEAAASGINLLNDTILPPKVSLHVKKGDCLTIETPGGGGWGKGK
ncbi:MAG: hydantoinase B/oxoprolinase family protein [Gammaproteobacteria bacterium]|nr:hydantoinase B/oxoprolinase family protein [Gammaproteobacteria bacterium]